MNIFAGVGKITDIQMNGKVLKFSLSVVQKKMCKSPCVIFGPNEEDKDYLEKLTVADQLVWLKGILASNQFEYKGKQISKLEVLTYATSIKPV